MPTPSSLPFAAQVIPSLPEILSFAVLCPAVRAGLFISENDAPAVLIRRYRREL
jgi:hypothetical protein